MSTAYEIPLSSVDQRFLIPLNGVTYQLPTKWCAPASAWTLDIADEGGVALVSDIPIITGIDLLEQYQHLGSAGQLVAQTDGDTFAVPTQANLGSAGRLYFIANDATASTAATSGFYEAPATPGFNALSVLGALVPDAGAIIVGTGATWITQTGGDVYRVGGTDVAVADGGTGASTAAGALTNLGISVRSRNILINGDTRFDQRHGGAAQTITAGAALAYTVDRWYAYCTGANVTGQRIAGTAPSQYRYRFTGASSVTAIGFAQRIEAANSFYLAGETATLSVELANSVLTAVTWTAYYANSTDTFGTVASPTRTQIATGTFTVNSTVARYSAPISVSASATTGIEIVLSVGTQTSGTWTIGAVQLAKGAGVTEFEYSDVQYTLNKCLRYYEKSYDMAVIPGTVNSNGCWMSVAINSGDFNDFGRLEWRARKRATPTVTVYSAGTGTAGKSYQQGSTDVTCTVTWVGECGAHLLLSGATGSQYQQLHWTCEAEL